MTTSMVLLPGVDRWGAGYRVRKTFPTLGRVCETGFATPQEANARALELDRLKAAGQSPYQASTDPALGDLIDLYLSRKRAGVSAKTGRPLSGKTLAWWEESLEPWRDTFGSVPLSLLAVIAIDDALMRLRLRAPTLARNALQCLKTLLRWAGTRGLGFDSRLLGLEPVAVQKRRRKALTREQLLFLADHVPSYARRLVLFKGTTGMRSGEIFTLEDERVDLDAMMVYVPASLCKERRDKWIPIGPDEARMIRLERLERAPGSTLAFPKREGGQWRSQHFEKLVWSKGCLRAAAAWREAHGLDDEAPTPFCDLTPHDLRSTAATIMRDAGMPRDAVAARLGHGDDGALLDELYDVGDKARRAAQALAEHAPEGLLAGVIS